MLRILQIGMHDNLGGVETFLMNYYQNIDRKIIQFDFISMYDHISYEDEIKNMGGKIYNIPSVKKNPIQYYKQLKRIIIENNYSIVHINMLSAANILPILAASSSHVDNIIVHSHNGGIPNGFFRKILNKINKKILISKANVFFACSKLAGDWMFNKKVDYKIIPNAIKLKKFQFNNEKRNKIRKNLNIESKYVIGHVGRFQQQKNHSFLIDIFYEFHKLCPDSVLLLIGVGELQNDIIKKTSQYCLNDSVYFLGKKENVCDYYQAMDAFVLPSLFEGLPVVGVEAQICDLNCFFSSNITSEVQLNEKTYFLSLDNSAYDWAQFIYNNINIKQRMKKNISDYNIVIQAKKLEQKYLQMIGSEKNEKI